MNESTTTLLVTVPVPIKERLDRLAQTTAQSASQLAADAIRAYVELQEWQIAEIEAGIREADAGEFATDVEVETVWTKWTSAH